MQQSLHRGILNITLIHFPNNIAGILMPFIRKHQKQEKLPQCTGC